MVSPFDKEHLKLIKKELTQFEEGALTLENLLEVTKKVEELIDVFKEVDHDWKEKFRSEWWELEFTSSLMMDEEREEFTDEDKAALDEAVQKMKKMLSSYV